MSETTKELKEEKEDDSVMSKLLIRNIHLL